MKPLPTDLDLAIAHFEAEAKALNRMIRAASAEGDHLIVYYHSEALTRLNAQLDNLYTLRDPLHRQKRHLEWRIKHYKSYLLSKLRHTQDEKLRQFLKKRMLNDIQELESELEELRKRPYRKVSPETQFIDEALFSLLEKRSRRFKLVLNEEEGTVLLFTLKKGMLEISILPVIENDESDFVFKNPVPNPFEGAGFSYHPKRKRYIFVHKLTGSRDVQDVKMWLAHLIIDVFQSPSVQLVYL